MEERSIAICGLPGSGKTTFLAALWHLVTSREIDTALRFDSLRNGDASHLNAIAARWRNAMVQDRTTMGANRLVSMRLVNTAGTRVRLTFPDVSGEAFRQIWEERDCDVTVADMLRSGEVLLFVHADTIQAPRWVVEDTSLVRQLGLTTVEGEEVTWHPKLAPTQVQLVDLLQLLRKPPLDIGPRRLAVILSAWDKVIAEGMLPEELLEVKLPLLKQYLNQQSDGWVWTAYGLSAQGGDYDRLDPNTPLSSEAQAIRELDSASTRIRLVGNGRESHDLTEPLVWLLE